MSDPDRIYRKCTGIACVHTGTIGKPYNYKAPIYKIGEGRDSLSEETKPHRGEISTIDENFHPEDYAPNPSIHYPFMPISHYDDAPGWKELLMTIGGLFGLIAIGWGGLWLKHKFWDKD